MAFGPLGCPLVQDIPAAGQELFYAVAVSQDFRLKALPFSFAFLDGKVFFIQRLPPVFDTHLLQGLNSQLLYMEAVRYTGCQREAPPYDQVHAPRHIQGYLKDPITLILRYFAQNPDYLFRPGPCNDGNDRAFLSLSCLVGNDGIELPMGEAGFIDGELCPQVLGKQHVLIGMGSLRPGDIIAQVAFVMPLKLSAFYPMKAADGFNPTGLGID